MHGVGLNDSKLKAIEYCVPQNRRNTINTYSVNNLRASAWVLSGSILFSVIGALVKSLDGAISIGQILLCRQAILLCCLLPLFFNQGWQAFHTQALGLQLLRVIFAGIALSGSFYAVQYIPLADATVLGFSKVMFITIFAFVILKEPVGIRRCGATLVGFVGVVVVLNPGAGTLTEYCVVALLSAVGAAAAVLVVKVLSRVASPQQLILYQAVCLGLISVPFAWYFWVWPSFTEWVLLIGVGVVSYLAQYCNVSAYRLGEASFLAPFDYFRLLGAGVIGYWVFVEIPGWRTVIGAVLIMGASVYTVIREVRQKQDLNTSGAKRFGEA